MVTQKKRKSIHSKQLQTRSKQIQVPSTITEYIKTYPKPVQKRLNEIRKMIRNAAPLAEEKLSYGMPYFSLNGRLIYFAAFKNHIGFYPMASGIQKFKDHLVNFKHAKGSVQFPHDRPLPITLINQIIKFRVQENSKLKKMSPNKTQKK